jgi:hypothetical protein
MVELHFWMLGGLYEPYYSYARIMLTKFTLLASLLDDLYDNYSTTEESDIFTAAMERFTYIAHFFGIITQGVKRIYILLINKTFTCACTTTIGRWDEQTTEKFPAHMKALLINILNTTNKIARRS